MLIRVLLLLIFCLGPAAAQDWQAEWKRTVAAAEMEGALIISAPTTHEIRNFIAARWAKDFPKIRITQTNVLGSEFIPRIKQERQAGKYLWDVAFSAMTAGYELGKVGIVDPLRPEFILPDVKDPATWGGWDAAFYDKRHINVLSVLVQVETPFFNADRVPAAKVAAQGMNILFDPAYKGRIIWHDPLTNGSGRSYALDIRERFGDEGLRRLIVDQKASFRERPSQVSEAMARGLYDIAIGGTLKATLKPYLEAGLKLDIRPFGNGPEVAHLTSGASTLYVFNKRPHPNAARVFVNWLLTKEIQSGLAQALSMSSRRVDVAAEVDPEHRQVPGKPYVETQREELRPPLNEAQDVIRRIRGN